MKYVVLLALFAAALPAPAADKLTDEDRIEIIRGLTAEFATAKVIIPRSKKPLAFESKKGRRSANWTKLATTRVTDIPNNAHFSLARFWPADCRYVLISAAMPAKLVSWTSTVSVPNDCGGNVSRVNAWTYSPGHAPIMPPSRAATPSARFQTGQSSSVSRGKAATAGRINAHRYISDPTATAVG